MKAVSVEEDVLNQVADLLSTDVASIKSKWPEFAASVERCDSCGRNLNFYDFVKTAFDSGTHSKEYMVNFFLGSKAMEKQMNTSITCCSCGKSHPVEVMYRYGGPHTCS